MNGFYLDIRLQILFLLTMAYCVSFGAANQSPMLSAMSNPPEHRVMLAALPQAVQSLAVSPDGKTLAVSFSSEYAGKGPAGVQLWELGTKRLLHSWKTWKQVSSLAFSPDGTTVAGACADAKARVWSVATGKVVQDFQYPCAKCDLNTIAFSPDGRIVFGGGGFFSYGNDEGKIVKWDAHTGKVITSVTAAMSEVTFLVVSPDGRRIAAVCRSWYNNDILGEQAMLGDIGVRLYDPQTGQLKPEYSPQRTSDGVKYSGGYSYFYEKALAFSPDNRMLAGAAGEELLLARLDSGIAQRMELPQQDRYDKEGVIDCVAFSPDGKILVSGTRTGLICLWNPGTGRPMHLFRASKSGIHNIAFADGGRILISGSEDGKVQLWPMK